MKILFTGGGTGGHFYPIVAIIEALQVLIEEERLVGVEFIFMSDSPYDNDLLIKQDVRFKQIGAGKMRRYFSLLNITDFFKTLANASTGPTPVSASCISLPLARSRMVASGRTPSSIRR